MRSPRVDRPGWESRSATCSWGVSFSMAGKGPVSWPGQPPSPGALGTPAILVLASRRLQGPCWARSKRIPGRAAPPPPQPRAGAAPPHPRPAGPGRWWPKASQAAHGPVCAPLPSPLLRAAGCSPASLTQRAGHVGQQADSLVPSHAEVRTSEMQPRGPGALLLLLPLLVAFPAQLSAQVSGHLRAPRRLARAQSWATLHWRRGLGLGATWGWARFSERGAGSPPPGALREAQVAPLRAQGRPGAPQGGSAACRVGARSPWDLRRRVPTRGVGYQRGQCPHARQLPISRANSSLPR